MDTKSLVHKTGHWRDEDLDVGHWNLEREGLHSLAGYGRAIKYGWVKAAGSAAHDQRDLAYDETTIPMNAARHAEYVTSIHNPALFR
jgi:hypothetical protein